MALCSRCDDLFDLVDINIKSIGAAIYEHGFGFKIRDDFCRRREGHGRHNHLITLGNPDGLQGQMQGSCAGIDRNGMLSPDPAPQILLRTARPLAPVVSHPDRSVARTDSTSSSLNFGHMKWEKLFHYEVMASENVQTSILSDHWLLRDSF